MDSDRRALLKTVGLGAGTALAGCLGISDDTETPTSGPGLENFDTLPFTIRNDPNWCSDAVGYAVVIDSESRQRAAFGTFAPDGSRHDEITNFIDSIDYETDRLVVVESGGPNACFNRLEVEDLRVEDGRLRADASVIDTSEGDEACASVETYPSTLLRVRFEESPVDEVAVDVTDGWGEEATVTAATDDSLSPDTADLSGHTRPGSDPSPVAPLDCEQEGVKRHDQWFDEEDTAWGNFEKDGETALALRVEETEYGYGDTVRVHLTNVADQNVSTGNREKYNLQVYTEDGWQDLRVKAEDDYFEYTDEAVNHPPGGGFDWAVEMTEKGIVEGTFHDDAEICPDLQSGRYRFAYFGVIGEGAVAVSFDLTV